MCLPSCSGQAETIAGGGADGADGCGDRPGVAGRAGVRVRAEVRRVPRARLLRARRGGAAVAPAAAADRGVPRRRRLLAPFGDNGTVLDGEIVVWQAGRLDFAALQDRLRSGPARVRDLATAAPAAYVVFDLLAQQGIDLRDRSYTARRAALEALLRNRGLPPGVVLTPPTPDPAVARSWLAGHTASGIEGVVAKRADQPYRPGVRGWHKLRARLTAEAVIAGVLGPVH